MVPNWVVLGKEFGQESWKRVRVDERTKDRVMSELVFSVIFEVFIFSVFLLDGIHEPNQTVRMHVGVLGELQTIGSQFLSHNVLEFLHFKVLTRNR